MRFPTMSLAAAMLAVVLTAVDLAVERWFHGPKEVANRLGLILSLLPMANVLPVLGLAMMSRAGRRPFAVGFLACGLLAMLAHVACDALFPEAMGRAYFRPVNPFLAFCLKHRVPGSIAAHGDGSAYFVYYPAVALVYCLPQIMVAGLGGLIVRLRASPSRAVLAPSDGR